MRITKLNLLIIFVVIIPVMFSGCERGDNTPQVYMEPEAVSFNRAVAIIHPLNASDISGIVYFNLAQNGIEVIADIKGLEPGKHGFHIHEFGDLRAEDGTSAGGHFSPGNNPHGQPDSDERHVGDLGNIIAIENEDASYFKWLDTMITFTGEHSIIGRSVIIHENEDDFESQPSGNAGLRIGGGVIGIANENRK